MRAVVPLGKRTLTGYVLEISSQPDLDPQRFKPINDLPDHEPLLIPEVINLCSRLARYYVASLGEMLRSALPPGINYTGRQAFRLNPDRENDSELEQLTLERREILEVLRRHPGITDRYVARLVRKPGVRYDLHYLLRHGWIKAREEMRGRTPEPRREIWYRLPEAVSPAEMKAQIAAFPRRRKAQLAILEFLLRGGAQSRKDLLSRFNASPLRKLLADGLVEEFSREVREGERPGFLDPRVHHITLNAEQQAVLNELSRALDKGGFAPFLLRGVTGSGKTQVYLEIIRKVVEQGKNALVLVPEISLTPLIVGRFKAFFPGVVEVLHSGLSERRRYEAWWSVRRGKARVVVGARSAVFAPLENLGIIIVDEEHDPSFKQFDPAPRYHARDAAVYRASLLGIPILLGSATPSLESWWNARSGRYRLLELPRRVESRPRPEVLLVDMREEQKRLTGKTVRIFSDTFIRELVDTLDRDEQAIILQNRRGFSTYLQCLDCGELEQCPHCDVTLTYHKRFGNLKCHYCGFSKELSTTCVHCGSSRVQLFGTGTQKVEEELHRMFPELPILRMDQDTTRAPGSYEKMVSAFNEGHYRILLGTQSVAKGHDFPRVTFVGVVNAETELGFPDFRAHERTFSLLTLVAGRAGRAERPGRVVIQTYRPENPSIAHAVRQDHAGFVSEELEMRRRLNYPPYSRLALLTIKGPERTDARNAAERLLPRVQEIRGPLQVLGPTPAPIQKIWREYRFHLLLKSSRENDPGGAYLRKVVLELHRWFLKHLERRGVYLTVNLDPMSLL